jgi:hypothetical protein
VKLDVRSLCLYSGFIVFKPPSLYPWWVYILIGGGVACLTCPVCGFRSLISVVLYVAGRLCSQIMSLWWVVLLFCCVDCYYPLKILACCNTRKVCYFILWFDL